MIKNADFVVAKNKDILIATEDDSLDLNWPAFWHIKDNTLYIYQKGTSFQLKGKVPLLDGDEDMFNNAKKVTLVNIYEGSKLREYPVVEKTDFHAEA